MTQEDQAVNPRELVARIDKLLEKEDEALLSFWDHDEFCFAANINSFKENQLGTNYQVSCSSTSYWLFHILEDQSLRDRFCQHVKSYVTSRELDDSAKSLDVPGRIAHSLQESQWKSQDLAPFNIYTSPLVIVALDKLGADFRHPKISKGLGTILHGILSRRGSGAAKYHPYGDSAFLTYWSFRALRCTAKSHHELDDTLIHNCRRAIGKIVNWAELEVVKQIALDSAEDKQFDSIQLAYALVTYVLGYRGEFQLNRSAEVNNLIVKRAIEIIFSYQLNNWG